MSDTLESDQHYDASVAHEPIKNLDSQPLFQEDDDNDELLASPPHKNRRGLIIGSIVLLVIIVGGGILLYTQRAQASSVQYRTVAVASGNLTTQVSASGPLQPAAEYDLNFSTAGKVQTINVHVGQNVSSGTVLATLSAPNLQIAVQQAQDTVNNDQTAYNDDVTNGLAQTTIDAANNTLQIAKLQLQTAQNNNSAATLTAPGSATVVAINGSVGQNVSGSGAGSSSSSASSSAFITLLNTSSYTITASVNETDIANVQLNQQARFTVSAFPSKTFTATVTNISPLSTTSSGVVSYPVTLNVNMSSVGNTHLFPGMTATANITTAQRIGVELVSNSAFSFPTTAIQAGVITRSSLTQSSSGYGSSTASTTGTRHLVLVLRSGKLVPTVITTGLTNGTYSEVLSGLSDGDQVVVSATGGAFKNLSTTSGSSSTGRSGFGTGGFGGGTRSGSGG